MSSFFSFYFLFISFLRNYAILTKSLWKEVTIDV